MRNEPKIVLQKFWCHRGNLERNLSGFIDILPHLKVLIDTSSAFYKSQCFYRIRKLFKIKKIFKFIFLIIVFEYCLST